MLDTHELKARIDCRDLVEHDLGKPKSRSSSYNTYKCPLHHETKGYSLVVYADHWRCFGKCQRGGDAIAWMQEYHHLAFHEACERLTSGDLPQVKQLQIRQPESAPDSEPPDDDWQHAAREVAHIAMDTLWSREGQRAWDYLERERGLTEKTIVDAGLGYIPGGHREWKIIAELNVPCGIVIPWFGDGVIWGIKVRRAAGEPRYQQVRGGRISRGLYLGDDIRPGLPILLTEGEFDALIARQVGEGLISAAAIGSAANRRIHPRWYPKFLTATSILIRMDADQAGQGAAAQIASLSQAARCIQVPQGNYSNGAVGEPIFHNRYSYAGSNPVNHVDPSGLAFWLGRGEGILGRYLAGAISNNNLHVRIQNIAMIGQWENVHAEYPLPIGVLRRGGYTNETIQQALEALTALELSYVDLLDEITGEMWEIKPKDDEAVGQMINEAQIALMIVAQQLSLLKGNDHPINGAYDWTVAPNWNKGRSFSTIPVYLGTDPTGWMQFYAKQSQEGVIIWWKVQNTRPEPVPVPIMLPREVTWSARNREATHPSPVVIPGGGLQPVPGYASSPAEPMCTALCHYPGFTPARQATFEEQFWLGYVPTAIFMLCFTGAFSPLPGPYLRLAFAIP